MAKKIMLFIVFCCLVNISHATDVNFIEQMCQEYEALGWPCLFKVYASVPPYDCNSPCGDWCGYVFQGSGYNMEITLAPDGNGWSFAGTGYARYFAKARPECVYIDNGINVSIMLGYSEIYVSIESTHGLIDYFKGRKEIHWPYGGVVLNENIATENCIPAGYKYSNSEGEALVVPIFGVRDFNDIDWGEKPLKIRNFTDEYWQYIVNVNCLIAFSNSWLYAAEPLDCNLQ